MNLLITLEDLVSTDFKLEAVVIPVTDVDKAKAFYEDLDVSQAFHSATPGAQFHNDGDRLNGPADEHASYSSFATFNDPDGNTWLLQEVTTRLPGRIDTSEATYTSVDDLRQALQRAATAHGEHEARNGGKFDEQWPQWYATYMIAERTGQELPQ